MSSKKKDAITENPTISILENVEKEAATKFTKSQLISSKRFCDRRDILNALLKDDKEYTVEAVEQEILKYMKGKVR